MPDQVLRGRASPYFRRLPCLKKCWSHGGLNVYRRNEAFVTAGLTFGGIYLLSKHH